MGDRALVPAIGNYELWFVAQFVMGLAVLGAFFLLPPFVLGLPGATPGAVGLVMAVLASVTLGAPLIGVLLDRFGRYQAAQLAGIALFAVAFLILAAAENLRMTLFGAFILGLGGSLVITANLSLLAGSGLPGTVLPHRMSMLQMSLPAGQVIGLAGVAALLAYGVGYRGIFLVMAGVAAVGCVATALTSRPAEIRAREAAVRRAEASSDTPGGSDPRGGVVARFGLVLAVLFLAMFSLVVFESQYANFMADVFGIGSEVSAIGWAAFLLVSIPLFSVVGGWVHATSYRTVLLIGIAARGGAGLGLWLAAGSANVPAVVPLALAGLLMVMLPLVEVPGSLLVAIWSPYGPSGGQGGFGFALAAASIIGAGVGGWAATVFGYRSLVMLAAVIATMGVVLGTFLPATTVDGYEYGPERRRVG
jgi:MFS family permease